MIEDDNYSHNSIKVKLDEIEFLGSFFRCDLSGAPLNDNIIEADFSINLSKRVELNVGNEISIRLHADNITLFASKGE